MGEGVDDRVLSRCVVVLTSFERKLGAILLLQKRVGMVSACQHALVSNDGKAGRLTVEMNVTPVSGRSAI